MDSVPVPADREEPAPAAYRIREGRSQDREAISDLWLQLMDFHRARDPRFTVAADARVKYMRHAQEMMRSRNSRVLVASGVADGAVVGYILGELQNRPPIALPGLYGFVSDLYVQEAWRERGVGTALFLEMRRWFADRKATSVELYVSETNPVAASFWRDMGLTPFLCLYHLDS